MSETEMVTVRAGELSTDGFGSPLGKYAAGRDDTLREVIAYLNLVMEKIPEEYRDVARFVREMGGGYGEPENCSALAILYERPKTAEEVAEERATHERYEAESEARQRLEYLRLRQKFGGG